MLYPGDAQAWGPLAHLSFSAQALGNLQVLGLDVRRSSTATGTTSSTDRSPRTSWSGRTSRSYLHHCHNWQVGFGVYEQARQPSEQAFALGFLAHLAADTVAHNYFVPYKTVASFGRLGTGHAYWELRYDQKIDPEMWRLARRVSTRAVREHDDLLHRSLTSASLLPFTVSRQLFGSLLASARLRRFQHVSRMALARERRLLLEPDLLAEANILATGAILGLLADGERCRAARADATGERNLQDRQDDPEAARPAGPAPAAHARRGDGDRAHDARALPAGDRREAGAAAERRRAGCVGAGGCGLLRPRPPVV